MIVLNKIILKNLSNFKLIGNRNLQKIKYNELLKNNTIDEYVLNRFEDNPKINNKSL
jgi:hypothetical protein